MARSFLARFRKTAGRPRPFVRVACEQLEDRAAPALFNVLSAYTPAGINNNGFVTSGDWDKDGNRDLVMTNYGDGTSANAGKSITLVYGKGDGTFQSPTSLPVGAAADSVSYMAIGDLNNDGNQDFVTCQTNQQSQGGTITVFLGSAVGAFTKTAATPQASGGDRPSWVGIADLTGDGNQDVLVIHLGNTNTAGGRTITAFKGDGKGALTLGFKLDIPLADGVSTAAAIAKLDDDDIPDLAVTYATVPPDDLAPQGNGVVRTFTGVGDGSFTQASVYDSGGPLPINITAADVDNAPGLDLVVANAGDPDVRNLYANFGAGKAVGVLRNAGNGNFGPTTQLTVGLSSAFSVSVSDFNFDGTPDIAVADLGKPDSLFTAGTDGAVVIYLGRTDKFGFVAEADSPYSTNESGAQFLVVDNFDSNPTPDVVVVHESNRVVTMLNTTVAAAPTATTMAPTGGPTQFGQPVTLTATVTSPGGLPAGTVTFFAGANPVGAPAQLVNVGGTMQATLTTTAIPGGTNSITARFDGGGGFASSKSAPVAHKVTPATSTTTLAAAPTSVTFGQPVTFTATVSSAAAPPAGSVDFFEGGTKIGSGTLANVGGSQVATFTAPALSGGTHTVVAKFGGAGNFAPSESAAATVQVAPAATTITVTAAPSPAFVGQDVVLTATVSSPAGAPGGTVSFFDGATAIGSAPLAANGGQQVATLTVPSLGLGAHSITAKFAATSDFTASETGAVPVSVDRIPTTVTISGGGGASLFSQPVTFTAAVTAPFGTPTGPVTFFAGDTALGTAMLDGGTATFTATTIGVGSQAVTAKFTAPGNFLPGASAALTQVVNPVPTTVTVAADPNPAAPGRPVTLTVSVAGPAGAGVTPTGTVTFKAGDVTLGTAQLAGGKATLVTSALPAGKSVVTVSFAGTGMVPGSATVTAEVAASAPGGVGLLGSREFGAGAGAGFPGVARFFNPDGSERYSADIFPGFNGGVRVTSADFSGDGVADLVAGSGPGSASRVLILDGKTKAQLFSIDPFEPAFVGGVYVAAGDVTGDGRPDLVISPDEGGGPRVRVFSGDGFGPVIDFFGIDDPNFRGGARTSTGDVDGDGVADLVVSAGFQGGPRVAGFSGKTLASGNPVRVFGDFFAFEQTLRNGVFITAGDVDGDGFADVIAGGGPGGGPRVTAFSGKALLGNEYVPVANFFAGNPDNRGGIRVAARNLDGDDRADLVVGDGTAAGSRVTGYLGKDVRVGFTPAEAFAFDAYPGFAGGVFVG